MSSRWLILLWLTSVYGAFLLGTMAMRRHLTGRWLPEVSFLDWLRGDDESGVD